MHAPHRPRSAYPARSRHAARPLSTYGQEPGPAPVSAARLAAEALFSGRSDPQPSTEPVPVIVLKRRGALAQGAHPSTAAATPGAGADLAERTPRVFTLRTKPLDAVDAPPAAETSPGMQEPAVPTGTRTRRMRRAERIGHDTQARVIRHVKLAVADVSADGAGSLPQDAPQQDSPEQDSAPGTATLLRLLAEVDAVLDAIRQARAFTLNEVARDAEWQRLSRGTDALMRRARAGRGAPGSE